MKVLKSIKSFELENEFLTIEMEQIRGGERYPTYQSAHRSTAATSGGGDTDCADSTYLDGEAPLIWFITI